jgi:hypothetical protein
MDLGEDLVKVYITQVHLTSNFNFKTTQMGGKDNFVDST